MIHFIDTDDPYKLADEVANRASVYKDQHNSNLYIVAIDGIAWSTVSSEEEGIKLAFDLIEAGA